MPNTTQQCSTTPDFLISDGTAHALASGLAYFQTSGPIVTFAQTGTITPDLADEVEARIGEDGMTVAAMYRIRDLVRYIRTYSDTVGRRAAVPGWGDL